MNAAGSDSGKAARPGRAKAGRGTAGQGTNDRGAGTTASRLPRSRAELLDLHRELRHRRDAAPLDSHERAQAMAEIGRVEVEIARLERAMDPPLV